MGDDETLAVELGAMLHERRIVEMKRNALVVEVCFRDEYVGASNGRKEPFGPLRVARVDDRPTLELYAEGVGGCPAGVNDLVRRHTQGPHGARGTLGKLDELRFELPVRSPPTPQQALPPLPH